jgi:hypothetical protein
MRSRYASDSYASNKERRLRRIRRRACSELIHAYEHGELSLRRFDILSRAPKARQRRIVFAQKTKDTAHRLAAQTINEVLCRQTGPIRLSEISTANREALGALVPGTAGRPFRTR